MSATHIKFEERAGGRPEDLPSMREAKRQVEEEQARQRQFFPPTKGPGRMKKTIGAEPHKR